MKCQLCKDYAEYLTVIKIENLKHKYNKKHVGKSVCDGCLVNIGEKKYES